MAGKRNKLEGEYPNEDRLADMREAGIKLIEILCSPNPDQQCEQCLAIKDQKIEIEFAPPIPLPECDCRDCGCIYLATQ